MYSSNDLVIYAVLIIPIIFLFIINRMSHSQNNNKVQIYKDKIIFLNETIKQLKETKQAVPRETAFSKNEELKKEKLLQEIEKQKLKIKELSAIAKDSLKTKYDFVSNMRHEVRTPLNSILVFAQLLQNSLKEKKHIEYVKNITASGNNLLIFVDKIIELGEVELGHFKKHETAIDIRSFLKEIVTKYESKAKSKGLLFTLEIDENLPSSLMLDRDKVNNILSNLLENALNFTKFGSIRIYLKLISVNKINNSVDIAFVVKDSGVGISEKHQQRIFDIFEKKEDGTVAEYQSTGLGLSVNKKVAKIIDGDLSVVSQLDKGSEFTLSLNNVEIVLMNKHDDVDESSIDFNLIKPEGGKIAIIDNQQQNLDLLEESFSATKIETFLFSDTKKAFDVLLHEKVDLLYIDINVLSADDGAVSLFLKSSMDIPVVTLVSGRMNEVEFNTNGIIPISHIKKPISKLELFKSSLLALNSQKLKVQDKSIVLEDDLSLDKNLESKKLKKFLDQTRVKLNILYDVASSSNDLSAMKVFAKSLLELSKVYEVVSMMHYAELLLQKIDSFDIDAINVLMKEYENKLQKLYERK